MSETERNSTALVTASYAPDFERCRLLCDTVEEFVTGVDRHYILVAPNDVSLFRTLQTSKRIVVDEREILPAWLRSFADPTSLFRRRLWISARTAPLRGWHVQQLRRIGIAAVAQEETLAYCDSDVLFLKAFDASQFWRDGKLRLFRRENALKATDAGEHPAWSRNAGKVLGIDAPAVSPHDYIATLIAWRRETVLAMCGRIETLSGKHWVEAIASDRRFSECMLYGRFVDEVESVAGHFHDNHDLCKVHWNGTPMSDADIRKFVANMTPEQVAIGMQSFIGTDVGRIRALLAA